MSSSEHAQNRKTYNKYTREMRLRLIQLVQEQNISTAEAGRIVGIKQTSACRIINSYRKFNRIFQRKADRLDREGTRSNQKEQKNRSNIMEKNGQNDVLKKEATSIEASSQQKDQEERKSDLLGQNSTTICCPKFEHKSSFQVPLSLNFNIFNQWGALGAFPQPCFWPRPFYY